MKTITITLNDAKAWLRAVDETDYIRMPSKRWHEFMPVIDRLRELVAEAEGDKTL